MARALMGHIGSGNEQLLGFEVARLRRRVEELQSELADLRAHQHSATASDTALDLELHQLAVDSQPALT